LRGVALGVLLVALRPLELAAQLPRLFVRLLGTRPNAGAIRAAVLEEREPPKDDERTP
jgi:hypothetical protein